MILENGYIKISTAWIKRLLGFLLEAIIVLSIVIFGINFFNAMPNPSKAISSSDSIAIANTFTVFVTFIFVVFTVAITLAGIYFSRWWSREKKQILSDNWTDMVKEIKENDKLMTELKKGLLSESLEKMMKDDLKQYKEEINEETTIKLRKMDTYIMEILNTLKNPNTNTVLNDGQIKNISKSLQGETDA